MPFYSSHSRRKVQNFHVIWQLYVFIIMYEPKTTEVEIEPHGGKS